MPKLLKNERLTNKIHKAITLDDNNVFKSALDEAVKKKININFIVDGYFSLNSALLQCTEDEFHNKAQKLLNGFEIVVTKALTKFITKELFLNEIVTEIDKYLGQESVNFDDTKSQEILSKIFDQVITLRKEKDIINQHYKTLNIVRKIIICINKYCTNTWQQTNRTSATYLLSKTECLVEDAIIHTKSSQVLNTTYCPEEARYPFTPKFATKVATEIPFSTNRIDWYKNKKYNNFEEFMCRANGGKNKFLPRFPFLDINKDEVLCRLSSNHNDMCLLDAATVTPRGISSREEAQKLATASQKLLMINNNTQQVSQILAKESLTPEDLLELDILMRPGKHKEIHIINFIPSTHCYEDLWTDITEQAFITGATMYGFNYPGINASEGKIGHKNDLIYAGIAMVNKLLDQGIHPDKIILQGYSLGADITLEVARQFYITGEVDLTYCNYKALPSSTKTPLPISTTLTMADKSKSRHDIGLRRLYMHAEGNTVSSEFNLSNKVAEKMISKNLDDCPKDFREVRDFLEVEIHGMHLAEYASISKSYSRFWHLKDIETKSGIPYFQLLNYFISRAQEFFSTNKEFKNPYLPKERVEYITEAKNNQNFLIM